MIESCRRHDNSARPHASLGYRPPAPEVFVPALSARPAAPARPPVATRPTMHKHSNCTTQGRPIKVRMPQGRCGSLLLRCNRLGNVDSLPGS